MLDFEVPRYQAALKGFAAAFSEGYAAGKQSRAAGEALLDDVPTVFVIEVRANHVLDDEWRSYCDNFKDAGRRAALAQRRKGEAVLDPPQNDEPDFDTDNFKWRVRLNS